MVLICQRSGLAQTLPNSSPNNNNKMSSQLFSSPLLHKPFQVTHFPSPSKARRHGRCLNCSSSDPNLQFTLSLPEGTILLRENTWSLIKAFLLFSP